eukprot:gene33075-42787_t
MGLKDKAVPVQAAAACSLRLIISAEGAADIIRPLLPALVAEYFRIMDEVESESVLNALQAIVLQFGEEIADMALMMVQHLVAIFHNYSAAEDDEEAAFNATQCLDTIAAIIEAVDEKEAILLQLEGPLILGYLTYNSDQMSVALWSLCGPLLQALNDWAVDYISEIMVPILNYMSKDIGTFLSSSHNGQPMPLLLLAVVDKISPGPLDGLLPNILYITLTKLNNLGSTQQVVRELVMITEEEEKADDEKEDGGGQVSKGGSKGQQGADYAKALYVPEGGYDEEEDCVNAEDESYREALETMEKEVQ